MGDADVPTIADAGRAARRKIQSYRGTAHHPDPVGAVSRSVPGRRAGYLFFHLMRLAAAGLALAHRRARRRRLMRALADRPDHVVIDAGIPLELVRGRAAAARPFDYNRVGRS